MRTTIALIVLAGCSADVASHNECNNGEACQSIESAHDLTKFGVVDQRSEVFTSDGVDYTLVRIAYGAGDGCDDNGENCDVYSSYCAWVTNGTEYPLFFEFLYDDEQLFDPSLYCDDLGTCDMPGEALDINYDADYKDWAFFTSPDDDPLVLCV